MAYTIKIEGIEALDKAIQAKKIELAEKLKNVVDRGADKVKAAAIRKAPEKSGDLKRSIDKNEVWDRTGKISIYVGVQVNDIFKKADGWYARMQEKGTSKMRARPYLRPAFDENKAQIKQEIEAAIKEVL